MHGETVARLLINPLHAFDGGVWSVVLRFLRTSFGRFWCIRLHDHQIWWHGSPRYAVIELGTL